MMGKLFLRVLLLGIAIVLTVVLNSSLKTNNPDNPLGMQVDKILIEKSKRLMTVYCQGRELKSYRIALGLAPEGHKQAEGDGRTPEGIYKISLKNSKSRYHKSMKISYPDQNDLKNAQMKGILPGGDIYIHGLHPAFSFLGKLHIMKDWTLGCIAVTDSEIDELFDNTALGTIVEIKA